MMKLLCYNIDHGGRLGEEPRGRWAKLKEVINDINPDIVILLEAWGWVESDLTEFSDYCGYTYSFLSRSNTKHNLALISKIAPAKVASHIEDFHHSVLEADFGNLTIFGIHLSPKAEDVRVEEIRKIISLAANTQNPVIMGDFNSLSPHDEYDEAALLAKLKQSGITKFGTARLDRRTINEIERAGLIDVGKVFNAGPNVDYSVPTAINTDVDHLTRLRLDYTFTTRDFLGRIKNFSIVKNAKTDSASDHFPIVLELG